MRLLALLLAVLAASPVLAQDSLPPAPYAYRQLDDPAQEAKAQVRQRIAAGEEPEAIRSWLVERYGDYVSYAPRVTGLTWPLYALPVMLVLVALVLLRRRFGKGDPR